MAFEITAQQPENLEREIRKKCLDIFHKTKLLTRLPKDIAQVLAIETAEIDENMDNAGMLWSDTDEEVEGGINHGF